MTTETTPDVLELIEGDLMRLDEDLPAAPDAILLLRGKLDEAMRRGRELKPKLDALLMRWLEANGGRLTAGEWEYYVGPDKTEKPEDFRTAFDATFKGCGGDVDAFVDCLSVNALKPGAVKKVLGDKFDDYFVTTYTDKLKLQAVNTKYLPTK